MFIATNPVLKQSQLNYNREVFLRLAYYTTFVSSIATLLI